MLKNPYPNVTSGSTEEHKIVARVSTRDYHYHKRLFSCHTGLHDRILSTLYKAYTDEIKSYGLDPDNTLHQAWHTDHPNHTLPERILAGIRFDRVTGPVVGHSGGRDDARSTERVREEVRGVEGEQSDKKGGTRKRGSGKPRSKKEG